MEKDKQIHLRVTLEEKDKIEKNSKLMGFKQTSEYLRFLGLCKPSFEIEIHDHIGLKEVVKGKIHLDDKGK